MGGKALSTKTKRLDKEEYNDFLSLLKNSLKEKLPHLIILDIPYYQDKSNFSDIDLVISKYSNVHKDLINAFLCLGSKEFKQRKDMLFFEFNNVQVDIMLYEKESIEFAKNFYSYNDLISLLFKKVCSSQNLLLYPDGLFYKHKDVNGHFKKILITNEFKEVLELFNYNYLSYKGGFKSMDDIYHFIISSSCFPEWKFNKENFTKTDIESYQSRLVFRTIVDKINSKEKKPAEKGDELLKIALERFPNFNNRVKEYNLEILNKEKASLLFNGKIVSDITQLKTKELGDFITFIRNKIKLMKVNENIYFMELGEKGVKKMIENEFINYEK